jgi:hypothetical protein
MKKQVLTQKSLSQLFYSLTLILLCANVGSAQTVLEETFGSQEMPATFYTGQTSLPLVDYTENISGYVSTLFSAGTDAYLLFKTSGTIGRASLTAPLPTSTPLNPVLTDNTKLVTWTVNMKSSRLSTNQFSTTTGFPDNKYFNATILCASSNKVIGEVGTGNGTDGYAVIVQKSSANAALVSIGLIKFHNGIGVPATSTAVGVPLEGSELTRLIESSPLANPTATVLLSGTNPNNLSIKVTYNPTIDVWELFYREDSGTAFVDPSTGAYTKAGASIPDAFSTPMTHFGFAAGLQTSTSTGNLYQFDNFKIALSDPPAYTAPPVVEKRQAFDFSSNPIVSSLVGTGTGTLNWYDVATGGTVLTGSVALVSGATYYGSLINEGTESDRVATTVYVGNTLLKTLPLYENFDYTIGNKLIVMNNAASANAAGGNATGIGLGSWTISPSSNTTDDVTIVAGLPNTVSPTPAVIPSASGAAISFVGSGIDPELKFTNTTSGSLYSSFVFTAADVTTIVAAALPLDINYSTPTGIYSFLSEGVDPITSLPTTNYTSDVMFRKNIATGKFNLGLSKSNSSTDCVWSPTEYDFGTQHLIVISYENIGDATATNQVAKLWIDPETSTQPAVTLSQSAPTTSVSRSNIDRIKILQAASASTPTLVIDEIRVANNWGQALGGPSTLGVAKMDLSSLKVYPNPVTNGKLYISSANAVEKQVAIYSILGQKVLETKTTNNAEINVSKLAKGAYILKISEEGVSNTKKLIIQ